MSVAEVMKLPEGMKPWHGGDSAPADWDASKDVLLSNGYLAPLKAGLDEFWKPKISRRDDLLARVVAYTPRATTPTAPAIPVDREWRMVPVEPTKAMMDAAAFMWKDDRAKMWAAILAASPAYTPRPVEGDEYTRFADDMLARLFYPSGASRDDAKPYQIARQLAMAVKVLAARPVEAGPEKLPDFTLVGPCSTDSDHDENRFAITIDDKPIAWVTERAGKAILAAIITGGKQ